MQVIFFAAIPILPAVALMVWLVSYQSGQSYRQILSEVFRDHVQGLKEL